MIERIFYKKSTATIFIAAILILVLLLCALLITLVQMSAVKDRIAKFEQLLSDAEKGIIDRQQMREYLKSDDYVRKWAEENGRINDEDILWLQENAAKN